MLIRLIGVAIVVLGLIFKFDTIATVVLAGIVTGLVGGMSIMDILTTLGTSFVTQRTATLFVLTLPAIGICERYGLKEKAIDFIRSIKSATAGRVIIVIIIAHYTDFLHLLFHGIFELFDGVYSNCLVFCKEKADHCCS